MAGGLFLGVFGIWLFVQTVAGRLPARLLSFREGNLAVIGAPTISVPATRTATGEPRTIAGSVVNTTAPGMIWPTRGKVSQEFRPGHDGMDIYNSAGTPVNAARAGVVRSAGMNSGGYGNLVIVGHAGSIDTYYAHLQSIAVRPGDTVQTGQLVGGMGTTGRSTGVHLHFEVREGGTPRNPRGYIAGNPG